MTVKRTDIEIMAPAGSGESLIAALKAGADSVYFGVGQLNMRARSTANFGREDLPEIARTVASYGARSYLTLNTIIYDAELAEARALIEEAARAGIDAVIASDQAVILYARSKGLEVHISTQLNVSNLETVRFYSQWADVIVLARELSLEQVAAIAQGIQGDNICGPGGKPVKIEMFAHGALCMAVSGKCYLSYHESGCSANRGACRQLCRRSWTLTDPESGEQLATDGNYLLSPKDLCTIEFLDKFIEAGVRVLKIEGRARSAEYVKTVVETYDDALRALEDGSYCPQLTEQYIAQLSRVFNRGFWGGFYLGKPVAEITADYGSSATHRRVYIGKVTNYFKNISVAEVKIEAAPLKAGAETIITGETTGVVEFTAQGLRVDEKPVEQALQGTYCSLQTPEPVRRGDKLFVIVPAHSV